VSVVVMVGSQGALPVAREVLGALGEDFPAAVVYVQHRVPTAGSILATLLRRTASLPVREVGDGDPVAPGVIHVPVAGAQTTIAADRRFRVAEGPCIGDPLMATAAEVYGAAALGVVLSGRLRDGAEGLCRIKWAGGRALVQSPGTSEADGMPWAALATGCYDFVLPPAGLRAALVTLVAVPGAAELFGVRAHPVVAAVA
jgi:two-component system, chemotaxis family, protein-glutamate methylesterase/glutaminase